MGVVHKFNKLFKEEKNIIQYYKIFKSGFYTLVEGSCPRTNCLVRFYEILLTEQPISYLHLLLMVMVDSNEENLHQGPGSTILPTI